jgi:prepilin-type N-terminal cleavage/methylation domain-containing protein
MTKRNGFTLIEVLVVVSLLAVILPMAGGTIFFLLRAQSQSADGLREAMALSQFSHTFRSDAHAARSGRPSGPGPAQDKMVFDLGDSRTIEYLAERNGLVRRTVRRADVVERREQFRVGVASARFEFADQGKEAAVIVIPRIPGAAQLDGQSRPASGIRIAAIVGRDLRVAALPPRTGDKR